MSEFPHQWSPYARLQTQLACNPGGSDEQTWRIDDRTWGIEAALNRLLAEEPPVEEELYRAVRSASRKERYRKRLRRIHLPAEEPAGTSVEDAFDARERLRHAAGHVTPEDSALLRAVGEGYEYKEIAASTKVAAGTLRARVLRLRRTLGVRAGLHTLVAPIGVAG
jgi:DNA-binding NarL/FixJ family response regulator